MKRLFYILTATMVLFACAKQNELSVPSELGVKQSSVSVPCTEGSFDLAVLSDGEFSVSVPDDASWLSFENGARSITGSGDVSVRLHYQMNRGIIRSTVITLNRGPRHLEVPVSQAGILSKGIEFDVRSIVVPAQAGSHSVKVVTLCPDSDLDISVSYDGTQGWITEFHKSNNFLVFSVIENAEEYLRTASVTLSSKTDPSIVDVLQVGQLSSGAVLLPAGFEDLADIADGTLSADGLYLEGVVINDNSQGNGAPNANLSPVVQDNTLSGRTVYIQASDGSRGVMVVFNTLEDNFTRRYDTVHLLLEGTTVTAYDNPTRYVITDVTSDNLIYTKAGSSFDVVKKEKKMADLTPEDVYTFVTLKDCEIPIRKGPFMPIDTRLSSVINRYPMVIRDIEGQTMHLMTNLTASWQRDGKGIPEGSGDISGIIVHETCDNFEWDTARAAQMVAEGLVEDYITDIGEIGTYQIRPVTREEIAIAPKLEDGFSKILMEIRYFNKKYDKVVINVKEDVIYSTYPAVQYPTGDPSLGTLRVQGGSSPTVENYRDWTMLGPVVDGVIQDTSLGNGVVDYFGTQIQEIQQSSYASTGQLVETAGSAWRDVKWSTSKNWLATFSTKGLTSDNLPLSVQFGVCGGLGEQVGGPRYWIVEYSTDGSSWLSLGNYTVPDFPIRFSRKIWQCPGYKYLSFTLPFDTALLDKDNVYIRMHPVSDKAGTTTSYDGGKINTSLKSQLNYFAVRCNK